MWMTYRTRKGVAHWIVPGQNGPVPACNPGYLPPGRSQLNGTAITDYVADADAAPHCAKCAARMAKQHDWHRAANS